jgi:hypothetical protein
MSTPEKLGEKKEEKKTKKEGKKKKDKEKPEKGKEKKKSVEKQEEIKKKLTFSEVNDGKFSRITSFPNNPNLFLYYFNQFVFLHEDNEITLDFKFFTDLVISDLKILLIPYELFDLKVIKKNNLDYELDEKDIEKFFISYLKRFLISLKVLGIDVEFSYLLFLNAEFPNGMKMLFVSSQGPFYYSHFSYSKRIIDFKKDIFLSHSLDFTEPVDVKKYRDFGKFNKLPVFRHYKYGPESQVIAIMREVENKREFLDETFELLEEFYQENLLGEEVDKEKLGKIMISNKVSILVAFIN